MKKILFNILFFLAFYFHGCKKNITYKVIYSVNIVPINASLPVNTNIIYSNKNSHWNIENSNDLNWTYSLIRESDDHAFIRCEGKLNIKEININVKYNSTEESNNCTENNCSVEIRKNLR